MITPYFIFWLLSTITVLLGSPIRQHDLRILACIDVGPAVTFWRLPGYKVGVEQGKLVFFDETYDLLDHSVSLELRSSLVSVAPRVTLASKLNVSNCRWFSIVFVFIKLNLIDLY